MSDKALDHMRFMAELTPNSSLEREVVTRLETAEARVKSLETTLTLVKRWKSQWGKDTRRAMAMERLEDILRETS